MVEEVNDDRTWWQRVLHTEPAQLKGVIVALVSLGLIWGLDLTQLGSQLENSVDVVFGVLVPLLTAMWIRRSVYSPATVQRMVQEASTAPGIWVADGTATTGSTPQGSQDPPSGDPGLF